LATQYGPNEPAKEPVPVTHELTTSNRHLNIKPFASFGCAFPIRPLFEHTRSSSIGMGESRLLVSAVSGSASYPNSQGHGANNLSSGHNDRERALRAVNRKSDAPYPMSSGRVEFTEVGTRQICSFCVVRPGVVKTIRLRTIKKGNVPLKQLQRISNRLAREEEGDKGGALQSGDLWARSLILTPMLLDTASTPLTPVVY
jgi:hypothetical protein